jgi:phosphoheptose isomerase
VNIHLHKLKEKYPDLQPCLNDIEAAFEMAKSRLESGGKMLLCGNGGSAADCEHIIGELMKGFKRKRALPQEVIHRFEQAFADDGIEIAAKLQGVLPAISLVSQSALITAYANDISAEMIFAQQVYGYGRPGDVVWALSTSGNSANVIYALQVAKVMGLGTIGFTGSSGGKMKEFCDVCIRVPLEDTAEIQESHLPIYHALCLMLEEAFFPI